MGLVSNIRYALSKVVQSIKRPAQVKRLGAFIQQEKETIRHLPAEKPQQEKKGTLIIKCDDIGDFLIWQQVIPSIRENAGSPVYFVGNKVNRELVETWFDFADHYIWIDKSKWEDAAYRLSTYREVRSLNAAKAFTTLFTRNLRLDDMLLTASDANERIAWDMSHHAYYPGLSEELRECTTSTVMSPVKTELEYFRNIEFINRVYGLQQEKQFKPLFPDFGKQNRLAVVPVASAASKCWKPENFIQVIRQVAPLFDSIILLGGPDGLEACNQIEKNCNNLRIMNFCGQTSLPELIPFIGESRLLLCPDTFALHTAMLTATDTVLLTNGTNWQRFTNYAPYISSRLTVIYPPGFREDPGVVKLVYSRSEINGIRPETVIEAIRSMSST
jgi:ADP-heptose:LPS heptosyltransferase